MNRIERRQEARQGRRSSNRWVWFVGTILALGLIFVLWQGNRSTRPVQQLAPAQQKGPIIIKADSMEMLKLVNELWNSVDPANEANAYFPPFARERINWIIGEKKKGNLFLGMSGAQYSEEIPGEAWVMASMYVTTTTPHKPFISAHGAYFWALVRILHKTLVGLPQVAKNDFLIGMVHESVHLEKSEGELPSEDMSEARTEEELRAWSKTSQLVVRPLIEQGQPVRENFIRIDSAFNSCGYKLPCLAARRILDATMQDNWRRGQKIQ